MSSFDPFESAAPAEILLHRAPLIRVIAQLRFPVIASLGRADFIGPFQEAIRIRYPILRPEQTATFVPGPLGMSVQQGESILWRFHDTTDAWRVSLAPNFVALEATAYTDRDDFFGRFEEAVRALDKLVKLSFYDRLGVRYINRIHGPELERLPELVRSEVLGISAPSVSGLRHSLCESLFTSNDVALSTRWGRVPAGATTDPTAIDPIGEPSWVLDLDMSRAVQQSAFDADEVFRDGRAFASTMYKFFRWCVTPEFLTTFGGAA
ncbi:MAG: TIGR04255 family protein [Polyangiales bacterium]